LALAPACKQYRVADTDGSSEGKDAVAVGGSTGGGGTQGTGGTAGVTGAGGSNGGMGGSGVGGSGAGGKADAGVDGPSDGSANNCVERNFPGHANPITAIVFAPDGKSLASSDNGGVVRIWNLSNGGVVTQLVQPGHPIKAMDYSRDGSLLAVLWYDTAASLPSDPGAQNIDIWRTSDWTSTRTLDGRYGWAVKFAPDGHLVAAPSAAGSASVWDVTNGTMRSVSDPSDIGAAFAMAVSRDGRFIVTVGGDFKVSRWTFAGMLLGATLSHQSASIMAVDISPDATTIATAGMIANQLELWNMSDGSYIKTLNGKRADGVAFLPDGKSLAVVATGDVKTIRIADGAVTSYATDCGGIAVSPDGTLIASSLADLSIQTWCVR